MQEPSQEELRRPFDENIIDLSEEAENEEKNKIPPKKDHFWRTITIFVFAVALLRLFVMDPFLVHGTSMSPTFEEGNYVIVDKFTYKFSLPKRGDVVVFDAPTDDNRYFIKRVIGLPGERVVVDGEVVKIFSEKYPNGFTLREPYIGRQSNRVADITLQDDEFFVMGDNREVSSDSRLWGALKKEAISGKAVLRLLPFKDINILPGHIDHFPGNFYPGDEFVPNSETGENAGSLDEIDLQPKKTL